MKVVVYGGTGMLGQALLRECLLDPGVESVLTVGRRATGQRQPKLRELVLPDLFDHSSIAAELSGLDACFFCLGVSSAGMSEADYRRVTHDLTMAAARALAAASPGMTFHYVTGAGTDSTGKGRTMWARVKGETENELLAMASSGLFRAAYMYRPGYIQPMHGVVSKTPLYRLAYRVTTPLFPVLRRLAPRSVTTSEHFAQAMLEAARHGAPKRILESPDIEALAAALQMSRSNSSTPSRQTGTPQ